MFSLKFVKNGSGAGLLYSDGDRVISAMPTSGRNDGLSRAISMIGPPGTFGDARADVRLEAEQLHAVDAAERLARVVDPRRARSVPPSPFTSTPPFSTLRAASGRSSSAAGRRGSPISDCAPIALTPSVRVDRAVAVLVDAAAAARKRHRRAIAPGRRCSVPSAPPPWPTTLIAIVAMPLRASVPATTSGAPSFESVKPWPKIASASRPRAAVPAGSHRLNSSWFDRLHRRDAGLRADGRDHLGARLVVRRGVRAERDRPDAGESADSGEAAA